MPIEIAAKFRTKYPVQSVLPPKPPFYPQVVAAVVDPVSNAVRTTFYGSNGVPIDRHGHIIGTFFFTFQMRESGVNAAGDRVVCLIMGGSHRFAVMRTCSIVVGFDGTAAASTNIYDVHRIRGAPFINTGGTVVPESYSSPGSSMVGYAAAGAVTLSGQVDEPDGSTGTIARMYVLACPRSAGAVVAYRLPFAGSSRLVTDSCIFPGEGVCAQQQVASVVGDELSGYFCWDEYEFSHGRAP